MELFKGFIVKLKDSFLHGKKESFNYVLLLKLIKNFIFLNFKLSSLSSLILVLFGTLNTFYIYIHVFYLVSFWFVMLFLILLIAYNYKKFNLNLFNYLFIVLCLIFPIIVIYFF